MNVNVIGSLTHFHIVGNFVAYDGLSTFTQFILRQAIIICLEKLAMYFVQKLEEVEQLSFTLLHKIAHLANTSELRIIVLQQSLPMVLAFALIGCIRWHSIGIRFYRCV